jgi:hypothetical protein
MALKIAVLKNSLKTCPSPFIVRSNSSDVVEYERFVEIIAADVKTKNHELRLHHKPESAFEDSIRASLIIVREERPKLGIPNLLAVLAAGEDSGLIRASGRSTSRASGSASIRRQPSRGSSSPTRLESRSARPSIP